MRAGSPEESTDSAGGASVGPGKAMQRGVISPIRVLIGAAGLLLPLTVCLLRSLFTLPTGEVGGTRP